MATITLNTGGLTSGDRLNEWELRIKQLEEENRLLKNDVEFERRQSEKWKAKYDQSIEVRASLNKLNDDLHKSLRKCLGQDST